MSTPCWKSINLASATIFDLTDDIRLIRECECCLPDEEFSLSDRPQYEQKASRQHVVTSMLSFAELTKDEALEKAIMAANKDFIPTFDE